MSQISLLQPPFPESSSASAKEMTWRHLAGSSLSLAISQLLQQREGMLLLITADAPSAYRLEEELRFFAPQFANDIQVLPDWETLPYDNFSPHQDIISDRIRVLARLPGSKNGILIVAANTLMHRFAPPSYIAGHRFLLEEGQTQPLEGLRSQLDTAGYRHVNQVMEHGEYSIRGSILDVFPMGTQAPLRIDFFDDEIDSIRTFDADTQLSDAPIERISLLPAREFPTTPDGIERFRRQFRDQFEALTSRESVYQQVTQGIMPAGIEYFFPLFFDETATLFDYLPADTLVLTYGDLPKQIQKLWHDLQFRYEDRRWDRQKPILPPQQLFLAENELFEQLKQYPRIRLGVIEGQRSPGPVDFKTRPVPEVSVDARHKDPLHKIREHVNSARSKQQRILFCVESAGRRESLLELLGKGAIHPIELNHFADALTHEAPITIMVSPLEHSFYADLGDLPGLWVITESDLLGHRAPQRRRVDKKNAQQADALIKNLAELSLGQLVVHIDHGIGRYQGLTTLEAGGITTEFLTLDYHGNTKLFVPVASLHLISRYSGGDQDKVHLSKLGNDSWEKARKKAAEKVRDVAAELLEVYAQREAKPGYAFQVNDDDQIRFAAGFPFTETDDQQEAIAAVLNDMQTPRAMDRLVCGDVGFGKTEVAMRAAFTAVNDGKQVAVLVPTTLLAQQHFDNFQNRFADWPVRIELLSRFRTGKQTTSTLAALEEGKVDIVIGTHKLLQNDIKFHDLGLLIVDEEHRFGVRQKEQIKRLRADVDILTLTATPIPRTLNMAMNNIRDLSIIATPPARRLAVKTFVREYDKATVREAVLREILRGGQVYFLHNNVDTIEKTARELSELVPEARVHVAHGQMGERELEQIMADFYHQRFNVLVCTTIIETGIDVPTANTIIMDRADNLGLAQLHQLRGRVGRSHHQAYAYLLTPHPRRMTKDAVKRLEAISQLEDLGAGFVLATHDLEIRGAGELLGDEQSGQIETIGFSLYMEMLEEAVQALREGREPSLDQLLRQRTEVDLRIPALLPEAYIRDINIRLSMYKRIAGADSTHALEQLQVELIDRFGLLPEPAKNLIRVSEIRLQADPLGIRKIELGPQGGHVDFAERTPVEPATIIRLIQQEPTVYGMEGAQRLKIRQATSDTQERIKLIQSLLNTLTAEQR
ncbi:transcription-repair coupling factor [Aliidiomarina halalkaliphila]|uniref:Transcription-repair-coupling factor n=1 Tax=Aliidiomarina halalkaliphila TaxID=2593535 RepID=A0A552X4P0_9GAMM|nr:transcription-repair coupling factor [Aliidiomarina halalkaliphila]TRW49987.1 transcription-repair coupling factor [Aliidiomarina halalkaliphila]